MSRVPHPPIELTASAEPPGPQEGGRGDDLRQMVARLILDTTNEGIWLIDAQARTTFVNRAAAELLGYAEDEMIGLHVFELTEEGGQPAARENLLRRQRGIEERREVRLRRKDGTTIWVIGSVNPVYDRSGQYAGALGLFGDLTAQKQREAELRAEIAGLRRRLEALPARPETGYREPFRTAIVLGVLGSVVAISAFSAAGALLGAVRGRAPTTPADL